MKSKFFFTIIIFLLINNIHLNAQKLKAFLSHSAFQIPNETAYVDVFIEIDGTSVKYKLNENNKYQSDIQIIMLLKQDSIIKDFKKYVLKSSENNDSLKGYANFVDVQRFALNNGRYNIEIMVQDLLNETDNPYKINYPLNINFNNNDISVSDIELVSSYKKSEQQTILTKGGYDLVPFVDNFYPENINNLMYYCEFYNADKLLGLDASIVLKAKIINSDNNQILHNCVQTLKRKAKNVNILFSEFNISKLASGNYNLLVSLIDSTGETRIFKTLFFQRSNLKFDSGNLVANFTLDESIQIYFDKFNNIDTLRDYVLSMYPIAELNERIFIESQTKNSNISTLQNFFTKFWQKRSPTNSKYAWERYKHEVDKVNGAYGTQVKKGYATDMGRVYLQYGQPNAIVDKPFEASGETPKVPYQIWHYYKIYTNERDVRFIFASSELLAREYTLIHSTAKGEIQDYNWQKRLQRHGNTDYSLEEKELKKDDKSTIFYKEPY